MVCSRGFFKLFPEGRVCWGFLNYAFGADSDTFTSERLALPRDPQRRPEMLANTLQEGPEEGCAFLPSAEIVSIFKIIVGALALHSLPSLTSWLLLTVTQSVL